MSARLGRRYACVAALSLALVGGSCASLPPPPAKVPEYAAATGQPAYNRSRPVLGNATAPEVSGFRLLEAGEDAYAALGALIDGARRSLDLQYYLIRDDASGRELLRRVHRAADRGVRVRILVDDLNTAGEEDLLLCMARQRGSKVRLYNPLPWGRFSTVSRVVASISDAQRLSARMHNKMLVSDNALAVIGGRNLGDAYFLRGEQANFLDLDLLVAGPVVRKLSASFDAFWNSDLAYPIDTLVTRTTDCNGADPVGLDKRPAPHDALPGGADKPAYLLKPLLDKGGLTWAPASLLADKPEKITSEGRPTPAETVSDDIEKLLMSAKKEVVLISPYFVPGERGMALAETLQRRGVKLRVLTNSLAATDAPAAHIGYARYRTRLLAMGVELHELQPQIDGPSRAGNFGSSQASLHAKALVIDRSVVLVGSMNMDPRSANLNSEIGFVVRSPAIADKVMRLYEEMTARSSYRVELLDGKQLRWTGNAGGGESMVYNAEPKVGPGLRLLLWLISPLAPEEML
jgi:putative cardiolipin synthase